MKIKNKLAGLALALGAVVAPLAAKATTETNAAPRTVEFSRSEKDQKLKEAIRLGLPREKLLEYVDFPKWIPTTKDGKFDSLKARKMFDNAGLNKPENKKAFLDYAATIERGGNADVAFQKFAKQITGGDAEKMAALSKIKEALQETQKHNDTEDMGSNARVWFASALLGTSFCMAVFGKSKPEDDYITFISSLVMMTLAGIGGSAMPTGSIYQAYIKTSKELYNVYATQEIQKAANPEIVQMDMKQAKQFIEFAKQNSSVK